MSHDEVHFDPTPHRPTVGRVVRTALLGGLVLGGVFVAGVLPRVRAQRAVHDAQVRAEEGVARLVVALPTRLASQGAGVTLPGSIVPVQETFIHARSNGYVRAYRADIGDAVTEGQVLAVIDTPELDQELRQAQAVAQQARANVQLARTQLALARTESTRYTALVDAGVVSQQETAQRRAQSEVQAASVEAALAAVANAEANIHRLQELKRYATVRAPFSGTITARTVEVGQLVTAGSSAGQALFRVSKTDVVRVMVSVPQLYAPTVREGAEATVRLREFATRTFRGTVTRTTHALDTATRTMLTEVRIPNPDGALLSGMYAQLTLPLARAAAPLTVPATALVTNADGTRMAVVQGGVLHWRPVQVESDLGDRVAVSGGLQEGEEVVVTPTDNLAEGMRVTTERMRAPTPAR